MHSRLLFLGIAAGSVAMAAAEAPSPLDHALAAELFQEAQTLSVRDGGRLWGTPVYGPMLFVDGRTRSLIANQSDSMRALHKIGSVYGGHLPDAIPVANTAIEWSGVHWTMVMWPLPEDSHSRQKLIMHECFHRIQTSLGVDVQDQPCGHLDSKDGRIWLQLEWRALGAALLTRGTPQRRAIQDALIFRGYRRSLFPESADAERALEWNEGLAEYTGIRLSARSEAQAVTDALVGLDQGARKPTYVRSFAYASGPAYGLLLDASAPGWRTQLKDRRDLGETLQRALRIIGAPRSNSEVQARAVGYGIGALTQDETRRESMRAAKVASFRSKLVEGFVLVLPRTGDFNYSFNPNNLVPLEKLGTVYPWIRASGPWGIIEASDGALLALGDLRVSAPTTTVGPAIKGAGWTLDLAPGWSLEPGSRHGDYRLVQKANKPAKVPGEGTTR